MIIIEKIQIAYNILEVPKYAAEIVLTLPLSELVALPIAEI
jgi:hypothetical protein